MPATNKYFIHRDAQPYLRGQLHTMIYRYLNGENFDDTSKAFCQAIYFNWKSDKISMQAFMFLSNFACWLDNDKQFPEAEERIYQNFCNLMTEEMEEDGWFEDEDEE